jgi:hypothetical protein
MHKVFSALRLVLSLILLSVIGVIIGVYLRGYTEHRWTEFIPHDRSFAALFPQPPAHEVEPAPPPFENSQAHVFTTSTHHGSYQISCFDSPMESKNAEAILVTDAVARFGGTLEMSGRPGEFLLLIRDGSVVYGRVLRTRQRIYRLLASRPDRQERDQEVQLFFDNFSPRN